MMSLPLRLVLLIGWGSLDAFFSHNARTVLLIARMASEERLLHAQFGAEYNACRVRTWRLLPWLY